jgi:hypothetical protein
VALERTPATTRSGAEGQRIWAAEVPDWVPSGLQFEILGTFPLFSRTLLFGILFLSYKLAIPLVCLYMVAASRPTLRRAARLVTEFNVTRWVARLREVFVAALALSESPLLSHAVFISTLPAVPTGGPLNPLRI